MTKVSGRTDAPEVRCDLTDTHTDPTDYGNPRCACAPRVNKGCKHYINVAIASVCIILWGEGNIPSSKSFKNCYNPLPTDCNIVGGDTQNYESLQPTDMTGYFLYRIPCDGTLVGVNATGFCILTERTHQHVSLLLVIYREDNGIPMTTYPIPADCDFVKNNSVSGIDYSFGSVSVNDLNVTVTSDDILGIEFFTTCDNFTCSFQPAIINDTRKYPLWFLEFGEEENEEDFSNVSLLFSATIETSSDKRGK